MDNELNEALKAMADKLAESETGQEILKKIALKRAAKVVDTMYDDAMESREGRECLLMSEILLIEGFIDKLADIHEKMPDDELTKTAEYLRYVLLGIDRFSRDHLGGAANEH